MRLPSIVLIAVMLLVGCATPPAAEPKQSASEPAALPVPNKPARPPKAPVYAAPQTTKPKPIPTRALNVATNCSFRDETGYNGRLKLSIEEARIQAFDAAVNIPKRGVCRFELKNFRQTRELPTVELSHLRDRCVVRVWEQGDRITVAFQDCRKHCSGSAWEHLWPILNDTRDGSCA